MAWGPRERVKRTSRRKSLISVLVRVLLVLVYVLWRRNQDLEAWPAGTRWQGFVLDEDRGLFSLGWIVQLICGHSSYDGIAVPTILMGTILTPRREGAAEDVVIRECSADVRIRHCTSCVRHWAQEPCTMSNNLPPHLINSARIEHLKSRNQCWSAQNLPK